MKNRVSATKGNFGRLRGFTGPFVSSEPRNRTCMPLLALLGIALGIAPALRSAAQTSKTSRVTIAGDQFMRDGKPYQIISGAIHYPRVPREYWPDRLRKAHAMGLNTVETYAFWNVHEPREGVFDFSGNNDIAEFVRMAQDEGLNVIVRPGPYVCAEWEAGGLPAWLFADASMKVRTRDARFLAAADRYLARLGRELAPLQATRGGPIIAVQVENEYGTYGNDRQYMEQIRQSVVRAGFGDSILFTSDGPKDMVHDALPGILPVINFGPDKAETSYARRFLAMIYLASTMRSFRFEQPSMTGEYWAGWYDAWGGRHARTDADLQAKELEWMLGRGYSVNLYMFHGGTSFGFMNGANYSGEDYLPLVTSYDYDAALDEAGRPTRKFFLFRDVIRRRTGITPPALPAPLPIASVTSFPLGNRLSLEQFAGSAGGGPSPVHGGVRSGLRLHSVPHGADWAGHRPVGGRRCAGLRCGLSGPQAARHDRSPPEADGIGRLRGAGGR